MIGRIQGATTETNFAGHNRPGATRRARFRVWAEPVRGVGGMGEADLVRCPVNILPAERVCQRKH